MARDTRHYIAGYIRHIIHRCHCKQFLLKFAKGRTRWLPWLFEARRFYRLAVFSAVEAVGDHPG